MTKILLCDLSHTTQGPTSELVPYPIGCIKSYFHKHTKFDADIRLIKDPNVLGEAFFRCAPEIVAFSNYMWNRHLSTEFARKIKEVNPETLILFGGPNFPAEDHRREAWLKRHDMVDIYLEGEGEIPFLEAVETWIETNSIEAVKRAGIFGARAIVEGALFKISQLGRDGFEDAPRLRDFDAMPSPYLMGYLDDFLSNPALVPLMESNRGCPFTCTYCVDGMAVRSRICKAPTSRLISELTYIAERYRGKSIYFADANFGMYEEDVDFCRAIAQIKEHYDFPHYIITSTGKNQKARIIECAKLLGGSLRVAASVQSLDEQVLHNIKRSNISYRELIEVSDQLSNTRANTYSEMILGLPGDTRKKHVKGVMSLVDAGFNQIRMHSLLLMEGSEMETLDERRKFGLETRHRVLQRSFGAYRFAGEAVRSVETEEVVVGGAGFRLEDYVYCRRLNLSVALFYNERVFFELQNFIKQRGGKVSEWLLFLHHAVEGVSGPIKEVYDRFTRETCDELHDSREELEERVLKEPEFFQSFLKGERGNNLLFNTQAHVFAHLMAELQAFAFRSTRSYLASNKIELSPVHETYLNELERYCFEKKRDFTDLDTVRDLDFAFDFAALEADFFERTPTRRRPCRIRFYYEPWQKEFFSDQFRIHGNTLQALGKIFARSPIKNAQRNIIRTGSGRRICPLPGRRVQDEPF